MVVAISALPRYVFVAWYLIKHRDNFTLTFTSGRAGGAPRPVVSNA
jgi:hypothetical protein